MGDENRPSAIRPSRSGVKSTRNSKKSSYRRSRKRPGSTRRSLTAKASSRRPKSFGSASTSGSGNSIDAKPRHSEYRALRSGTLNKYRYRRGGFALERTYRKHSCPKRDHQRLVQSRLRNCSIVKPASRTIPAMVSAYTGLCLGIVRIRTPSDMTTCFP